MKTLYERLGRTEGIRALVETVATNHLANPAIAKRFMPLTQDPERLATALGHLSTFLEAGAGGPAKYTGKDMVAAHRGMNISGEEYLAAMDDIMGALATHGIDEATKKDVLFMLYELKPTVARL
ncbi:MAG TPA: group 1 truncated hemoglobin [Polyangiaceae bacterium]|jgi:hemoglobin|nr:group 1 truncated hemoglobin [Polyangiaceae bacterium]